MTWLVCPNMSSPFQQLFADIANPGNRKRENEESSVLTNEGERVVCNLMKRCELCFYQPLKTAPVSHLKKLLAMRGGRDRNIVEKSEIVAKLNVGGAGDEDMCVMCQESMTDRDLTLLWPCGHSFHMTCNLEFEAKRAMRGTAKEELCCQLCMRIARKRFV